MYDYIPMYINNRWRLPLTICKVKVDYCIICVFFYKDEYEHKTLFVITHESCLLKIQSYICLKLNNIYVYK